MPATNEADLTDAQRTELRALLQAARAGHQRSLDGHRARQRSDDAIREQVAEDRDAVNETEAEREVDHALIGHDRQQIDAIDAALSRLDTAAAGHCIDCDGAIGFARLLSEPQALRCIACATRAESAALSGR